jgi:hypothetical protein
VGNTGGHKENQQLPALHFFWCFWISHDFPSLINVVQHGSTDLKKMEPSTHTLW